VPVKRDGAPVQMDPLRLVGRLGGLLQEADGDDRIERAALDEAGDVAIAVDVMEFLGGERVVGLVASAHNEPPRYQWLKD
jgi:hypothetical protein